MLKVLIVDDEYYFRQALKISLPWNELGFEICGEAGNGEDALSRIHELRPDIALVDINMPIMDGLDLVRQIKERGYLTRVIILTGYSEFNYAKQAVELGVNNYLLKPIEENELQKSLLEIREDINKEINIKLEIEYLKKQVRENIPILQEKFLNDIILGNLIIPYEEAIRKASTMGIQLDSLYFQVITIELDSIKEKLWDEKDKDLWKFAVHNIASEIIASKFRCNFCFDNNERICAIIGYDENTIDLSQEQLIAQCDLIRASVQKYLELTVTIGIGKVYRDIRSISLSYNECLYSLKNALVSGNNKVIVYNTIEEFQMIVNLFPMESRRNMLINMRLNNTSEVNNAITFLFNEFRARNANPEIIYTHCIELLSICFEFAAECKQVSIGALKSLTKSFEEVYHKNSLEDIENWIRDVFSATIDSIHKNKKNKSLKLTEDLKQFIDENYYKIDLRIDDIAKHFFINYNHLCTVFKKETSLTINEYITEVRIKKAKELIDRGNITIKAVAIEVGYDDPNYFSKCFKKYFGVTPSRYIENRNSD